MTAAAGGGLPGEAYAAALASLPGIGPSSLVGLLRRHPPEVAWSRVLAGEERRPEPPPGATRPARRAEWDVAARRVDVGRLWDGLADRGIGVTYLGRPDYPPVLRDDPEPAGVVFWRGDLTLLGRRCVAVVGTRLSSHYGREVAFEIGRDLAAAGICVVSGLALGIDGAAHAGALAAVGAGAAGPVGVAASGVDVPYPRRHATLWERVATTGAVVSETAPGQPAQAWRFPSRNRIIAGLSRAVVVVESRAGGGSMLTVAAAAGRGVEVLAVPGPVHSPVSEGTNQLLVEGCGPVRHAGDVLDSLGDVRPWPPQGQMTLMPSGPSDGHPGGRRVLDAIDWTATPAGLIARRSGLAIGPLSTVLHRLEDGGLVRQDADGWRRVRGR